MGQLMTPTLPSEILDRMPPCDIEAERCLLGSVLLSPTKLPDVATAVTPTDFYSEANQAIWAAMLAMDGAGKPLDAMLLARALKQRGQLEMVGGAAYLAELGITVPVAAHAMHYAGIVRQKARYRGLIHAATDVIRDAYAETGTPEQIADAAEAAMLAADRATDDGPVEASAAAVRAMERIQDMHANNRHAGLLTGLPCVDEAIGGLFPGELTILAARPGIGKTSFACQVAYHAALRGRQVYFVSLEMSPEELITRIVCGQADVSSKLIRTGHLTDNHLVRLCDAAQPFARARMVIHDKPGITVAEIRRWGRRIARKGLSLIVVDYLQLLTPPTRKIPRHEQVGLLSASLKELARELQVPVLCLTQLSREATKDSKPQLHHLRESGSIEQDADVVAFLYAPSKGDKDAATEAGHDPESWNAALSIAKNRNGETADLRLRWHPHRTIFTDPNINTFGDPCVMM
jgi:replicative DNA helicase